MPKTRPPLSTVLPPLIAGTATFNSQYNPDPYAIPSTAIVHRALTLGVCAFDTSPYYGPSEILLGSALSAPFVTENYPRSTYLLATKVGRLSADSFDYSPEWVGKSVRRSLQRLHTEYLDVVYCHDVEFVAAEETLAAVTELRRLRDEHNLVRYIGISGYPVPLLCSCAEYILEKTGEPLDVVQSYANYTLQNTQLLSIGLERLKRAGVDVVPNASVLGMGLLRREGVPIGGLGDWHPAPKGLRKKVAEASEWCNSVGEKIEKLAIRFSIEGWIREGSELGSSAKPPTGQEEVQQLADLMLQGARKNNHGDGAVRKLGVSVMGVSTLSELDETMRVWRSILKTLDGEAPFVPIDQGIDNKQNHTKLAPTASTVEAFPTPLKAADALEPETTTGVNLQNNTVNSSSHDLGAATTIDQNHSVPFHSRSTSHNSSPSEEDDHSWGIRRRAQVLDRAAEVRRILGREWADFAWDSPEKGFMNKRLENGGGGKKEDELGWEDEA